MSKKASRKRVAEIRSDFHKLGLDSIQAREKFRYGTLSAESSSKKTTKNKPDIITSGGTKFKE